ncbi:LptF/LptG family permease [Formicincola oecophyllae]|uniref:LptF/LptG family permease n=1 Tax=Formicincola oecophyllae TaxID=2558361 RepID=A0A4Y6U6A8_9PROT|nr:LptF/LptG family permease [Formicincola oecophyllae]QDH12879.1 LptF/LptG family permease [Formicincola oecophyllae]
MSVRSFLARFAVFAPSELMRDGLVPSPRELLRPKPTLARVFLKPLLARILMCSAVLCGLMEVLGLLDAVPMILRRHLGILGLFHFMGLHLPALFVETLPVAVLVGSLFTLMHMALSSELAALRASGLSTWGMFMEMLPAPLLLGVVGIGVQFWVVPPAEQALSAWWNVSATRVHDMASQPPVWYRERGHIVHISHVGGGGTHLEGVTFYQRQLGTGILQGLLHFPALDYQKGHWVVGQSAPGATGLAAAPASETVISPTREDGQINTFSGAPPLHAMPEQLNTMAMAQPLYTPGDLISAMRGRQPFSLPPSNYKMALLQALVLPVELVVMVLIALPVTYIPPRAGTRNPLPVYVLGAGLGIVILQGMISALGNAGSLPAYVAVSAGLVVAALFGITWILRMEDK